MKKSDSITHCENRVTRRRFLGTTSVAAAALAFPEMLSAAAPDVTDAEKQNIEKALPSSAPCTPCKPRKLLIFDLNVNYGGHGSIRTANHAFARMGQKTGAFEAVVSRDPNVFKPESLRRFDAVFFNNTVGNCFTDPELRQSLADFVYAGGGLMGVHGTTVGFTKWPGGVEDWPEFGLMIGARGANHRANDEHVCIKLDDAAHPLNRCFGGRGFEYRDEFFRVYDPYSRNRLRILFSIDGQKTDLKQGRPGGKLERDDNDFALAWLRNYGRGRTFYCTIAHHPAVFWDPKMLQFYLAAAQFVLGDLPAATIPSARLTPAIRAQEQLNWRLSIETGSFSKQTFFDAIEKTSQLGAVFINGSSLQTVSKDIPKNFAPGLTTEELRQIRFKLDSAGVRLLAYRMQNMPGDEESCRRFFEFGRKIGIEMFVSEPQSEAIGIIEKFCDSYDIKMALLDVDPNKPDTYLSPGTILKLCQNHSKRIGACINPGRWLRTGVDPIQATRSLKDRILAVNLHDLQESPHQKAPGKSVQVIQEIYSLGIKPSFWELSHPKDTPDPARQLGQSIEFFNKASMELSGVSQ